MSEFSWIARAWANSWRVTRCYCKIWFGVHLPHLSFSGIACVTRLITGHSTLSRPCESLSVTCKSTFARYTFLFIRSHDPIVVGLHVLVDPPLVSPASRVCALAPASGRGARSHKRTTDASRKTTRLGPRSLPLHSLSTHATSEVTHCSAPRTPTIARLAFATEADCRGGSPASPVALQHSSHQHASPHAWAATPHGMPPLCSSHGPDWSPPHTPLPPLFMPHAHMPGAAITEGPR